MPGKIQVPHTLLDIFEEKTPKPWPEEYPERFRYAIEHFRDFKEGCFNETLGFANEEEEEDYKDGMRHNFALIASMEVLLQNMHIKELDYYYGNHPPTREIVKKVIEIRRLEANN